MLVRRHDKVRDVRIVRSYKEGAMQRELEKLSTRKQPVIGLYSVGLKAYWAQFAKYHCLWQETLFAKPHRLRQQPRFAKPPRLKAQLKAPRKSPYSPHHQQKMADSS